MHRDAVDVGSARSRQAGAGGIRVGRHTFSGRRDELGRAGRGARRGVGLLRVVQFDHLRRFEVRRGLLREVHRQHRANREVRGDQHTGGRIVDQPASDLIEAGVGEPGGADDGVDAVADQELQVVHDGVRMGEVDDDLGGRIGKRTQRVTGIDFGTQLKIGGIAHRGAHRYTDLARRTQDPDPHGVSVVGGRPPNGYSGTPPRRCSKISDVWVPATSVSALRLSTTKDLRSSVSRAATWMRKSSAPARK